ncbi:plasmid partitioning protein [Streptomyces yokosukanensis]|uniref:Plasmid partitioning protein n=1 Tax=Streptomyces yokosukanensis TaxID=67386 RepID=A0A101NVW0_9ACTN|nr:ParB/RepB/Spo0J family partition protein [Streptomyces yokosukanensis]KUN00277.1 plasmid partitioning protein [Streptomyces yokosukanensis]
MSKADQLGAGRFGGGVRSVSARRQAVAAATGVPTDGVAPPTELPPQRISLNPDNPRSSLGDLTDLAGSLKTHGQKQAITVMNRDAYIRANPKREADLEADTTHVVIDGSSRLAAAREAQLLTIKVMVSDDQGTNSEELLESALVANIHRQDLGELDEARALKRLLAIHGSQTVLSKRLHRSQGWVSQRLALLNLTPELQSRIGEEPIDLLRAVANKPAAEQGAALQELKDERARKEEEKRNRKKLQEQEQEQEQQQASEAQASAAPRPSGEPEGYYGVIGDGASSGLRTSVNRQPEQADSTEERTGSAEAERRGETERRADVADGYYGVIGDAAPDAPEPAASSDSAVSSATAVSSAPDAPAVAPVPTGDEAAAQQPVPEPRTEVTASRAQTDGATGSHARRVPYDEPGTLAMLLDRNIASDDTFFDLLRFLSKKGLERDPARLAELAQSFAEQGAVQGE